MLAGIKGWFLALSIGKKIAVGATSLFAATVVAGAPPPTVDMQDSSDTVEVSEDVVTKEIVTETEIVPYVKTETTDPNIQEGERVTRTEGVEGKKTITYEVTYTNSVETGRTKVSEEITVNPINEVVAIGTYIAPAPPPQPSSASNGVVKMSRSFICHAPGTTYYSRTIHYTPYDSMEDCLNAGGRRPLR